MLARNIPLYVLLAFSLLMFSCTDDEGDSGLTGPVGPEPGGSNTETIGLLGGDVNYGTATVIIPPGALSAPEDITIEIPLSEPDYVEPAAVVQIGYMYQGSPSDLDFGFPINIAFIYDEDDIGIYDENTLALWTFAEAGDTLIELEDNYIDTANNVITGVAAQLAYFVLTASTEGIVTTAPSVPELIAPYIGMSDNRLSVTFRWESVFGAEYYHIQVAGDEEFLSTIYDESGLSKNSVGVSGLDPYSLYYWRIQARNEFGEAPWSEIWSFTTNDGSGTGTVEGTWEFDYGDGWESAGPDMEITFLESWGDFLISFGNGNFDAEGVIEFHEYQGWFYLHDELFYEYEIDEVGTYTVTNDSIFFGTDFSIDPDLISWNNGYEYELIDDTLILCRTSIYGLDYGEEVTYYVRR